MKPTQKKSSSAPRRLPKKAVIGIILIVVIATIGFALLGYRTQNEKRQAQETLDADKASFAKVEVEMARAYESMVAAAGKPDKAYNDTGCGRTNVKFAEGGLFCNITYTFAFSETSSESAYTHIRTIQNVLEKNRSFKVNTARDSESLDRTSNGAQSLDLGLGKLHELSCNLYWTFRKPENSEDFNSISSQYFSLYQFRCSQGVGLPVYPLAE